MNRAGPHPEGARRPGPREAYAQWIDACTRAGWRGGPDIEQVPIGEALGRITVAPVHARWSSPRLACAAMDGIAIRAGSAAGSAAAGHAAGSAAPATAGGTWQLAAAAFTWVDTGDPMPADTDTVVERERVELRADGSAKITGPAAPGLHVRASGEDFQAGQLLVAAGRRLGPADLAVAAAAGHAALAVARRPVVAIIPTGDEIRPVGSVLGPGEIIDSNSLMLAARASQVGAVPQVSFVQPDDPDALAAQTRLAALSADVVLVIAGSSAGRDDHTAAVLGQVGGMAVRGVAVRPGHPVLLGHVKPPGRMRSAPAAEVVPAIGVPGYPLAAAVIFELFALPLLAALQGARISTRGEQRAQLACDWASPPDVEDWVPVSLAPAPAGTPASAVATPGRRGAGSTSRLAQADAWWRIPAGRGRFGRGELVNVQPMPGALL
ncbi:MAG TPA: molybdopterin molybdotransferase MoeA [Trebonia sp.]|nr:molybdopterin molybdotransferase MoeA [Trebonia sp.]